MSLSRKRICKLLVYLCIMLQPHLDHLLRLSPISYPTQVCEHGLFASMAVAWSITESVRYSYYSTLSASSRTRCCGSGKLDKSRYTPRHSLFSTLSAPAARLALSASRCPMPRSRAPPTTTFSLPSSPLTCPVSISWSWWFVDFGVALSGPNLSQASVLCTHT
ncbi:hypothetical protein BC938DRAFT_481339 [Jimgerdemannia flammicorona]|uniref:Uncharacterized protein n=1 Tax=Jimgerdemannia flammicorona TaxID=994334 RepID=A0A433QGD8_9FUNG|nr:hypothetical protein BC938DRAFT_481339 [Jimgerdemannia flammicorona]